MAARAFDALSLLIVVGGIMVLVRPGSQGPQLASSLGNAFVGLMTAATGSGVPRGYTPTGWSQHK